MKAQALSKGQRVVVILNEPARLDQNWRLFFNQRWEYRSMLEVLDEFPGFVLEDTEPDDLFLYLCHFKLGGEPVENAITPIPWDKIQGVKTYVEAQVA